MRIWSIHPRYLDAKGLVALWRETLLARHVLAGSTKGYRNHPQLERFKVLASPLQAIDQYLAAVHDEASARGYRFDATKFDPSSPPILVAVTRGQVAYEFEHLMRKLAHRDPARHRTLVALPEVITHPLFTLTDGDVASWEKR